MASGQPVEERRRSARPTLCAALAALCAFGCQSSGNGARIAVIETEPPGAIVKVEGFGECVSPCSIELDAPRRLTIAKAGFKKRVMEITPGDRRVRVDLELAAPSGDVVADDLPPLE